jgi:hypothetical protein
MSYSSYMNDGFRHELVQLVLQGRDAGVPWMSDTLREIADRMDIRPAEQDMRTWLVPTPGRDTPPPLPPPEPGN